MVCERVGAVEVRVGHVHETAVREDCCESTRRAGHHRGVQSVSVDVGVVAKHTGRRRPEYPVLFDAVSIVHRDGRSRHGHLEGADVPASQRVAIAVLWARNAVEVPKRGRHASDGVRPCIDGDRAGTQAVITAGRIPEQRVSHEVAGTGLRGQREGHRAAEHVVAAHAPEDAVAHDGSAQAAGDALSVEQT